MHVQQECAFVLDFPALLQHVLTPEVQFVPVVECWEVFQAYI